MKKSAHKKLRVQLCIAVLLLLSLVIIHSCKKDTSPTATPIESKSNTDLIADAKSVLDKQVNIAQGKVQANGAGSAGKTLREQLAKQQE